MRYFLTTNASRSFATGDLTFSGFEPVGQRGGSWLGILAVDDSAASILAAAILAGEFSGIDEITGERYDSLKKKERVSSTSSPVSPNRARAPGINAKPAEPHGGPPDVNSTEGITAVTVLTGEVNPPREPLLEEPSIRRNRRRGK